MAALGVEQHMLAEDPPAMDAEPVTFAEALTDTAMRNALFENLAMADALSPTTREKLGVHAVGILLALCAGAVNAIASIKFGTFVSHVSGVSTAVGLRQEDEQDGSVMEPLEIIAYFIAGATLAGLIIPKATLKMGQGRYEVVLFLVATMELVCWWHELRYPHMLAAAMGLQNAMITSWSGAVLRTTHMTGTATDLGSALGRILSRFMRRDFVVHNYSDQDWDENTVDRQKLVLMCCLLAAFIGGGFVGAWSYGLMQLHALLLPACLTALLGAAHLAFVIAQREPLKTEKEAQEMFVRQLSGMPEPFSGPDQLKPPAEARNQLKPPAEARMEQFIRQISGVSGSPSRAAGA